MPTRTTGRDRGRIVEIGHLVELTQWPQDRPAPLSWTGVKFGVRPVASGRVSSTCWAQAGSSASHSDRPALNRPGGRRGWGPSPGEGASVTTAALDDRQTHRRLQPSLERLAAFPDMGTLRRTCLTPRRAFAGITHSGKSGWRQKKDSGIHSSLPDKQALEPLRAYLRRPPAQPRDGRDGRIRGLHYSVRPCANVFHR